MTSEWKGIPVGCPGEESAIAYELIGRPEKARRPAGLLAVHFPVAVPAGFGRELFEFLAALDIDVARAVVPPRACLASLNLAIAASHSCSL